MSESPGAADRRGRPPLIVHVVYRFDTGGLENGVVNLINRMDPAAYRHAVVALTEVTSFRDRVRRNDVEFVALDKPPGHAMHLYPSLWRLFRRWRPAVVHTRNLAALEAQLPAWAAGVPARVHGEHGRDVEDLDGSSRRHQWIRRLHAPFVTHQVALSGELTDYLVQRIGVGADHVTQICNGVDDQAFRPAADAHAAFANGPFDSSHWLIGTVGRMQSVKHQTLLARAFLRALALRPALRAYIRLALVGEGPLRAACQDLLAQGGAADLAWLPGQRDDVADVMRRLDCFVLPSLAEGISNTILEAMATGLPVIATDVGGNAELVGHGVSGEIVPSDDIEAMAQAIVRMAEDPARAKAMGRAGRSEVERRFSLRAMVASYQALYDRQLAAAGYPGRN